LGGWNAPIAELAALALGDEIILPDGADAWLEAAGIRLRPIQVEVVEQVVRAYPHRARAFQDEVRPNPPMRGDKKTPQRARG
ncbi:MAG: hypothetical protein ACREQC_17335, partial [Candidatus Binataceae bacterium]